MDETRSERRRRVHRGMRGMAVRVGLIAWAAWSASTVQGQASYDPVGSYVVVVSRSTFAEPPWRRVVDALRAKYDADVVVYAGSVGDAQAALARIMPRFACFVARPEEAGRDFVVAIHRLTRGLDDDPYTDVVWGMITGYEPADALRIVSRAEPLIVRRVLSGCGSVNLNAYDEGIKFNEGVAGGRWVKSAGGKEHKEEFPVDSTRGLVDGFNEFKPDLFVTSGHATETDWQIGYNYKDGSFRCRDGQLFGLDTEGKQHPIHSPNSKAFMPAGNCLIGHVSQRDCMALAMMHSAGVDQMFGYTAVTFYGFMGWGIKDMFEGTGGRYTLAESFYFINQSLVHKLETQYPRIARLDLESFATGDIERQAKGHRLEGRDELGLLWDRDVVAFFGDPAWEVRRPAGAVSWDLTVTENEGEYTVTVQATRDGAWGSRPVMAFLPERVLDVRIRRGEEWMPVVTDNFVLLPLSGEHAAGDTVELAFTGRKADEVRTSASSEPIEASRRAENHAATQPVVLPPDAKVAEPYRARVVAAVGRAGPNGPEIIEALRRVPAAHREAMAFLVANMPEVDLTSLSAPYLLDNVAVAYEARAAVPWGAGLPDELFFNYVLPYANVNERRDNWRKDFFGRFAPLVGDCQAAADAAQTLNREVFKRVGVRYHATKRPKADQSPYESIEAGYASCTGLSVLLADACRAVCVPARVVGVPQWTTMSGNHTWVEVWDGQWYFTGAAEWDPNGLNRAWFSPHAAKADASNPMHRIYASSYATTDVIFPLVWNPSLRYVHARDVTRFYTARRAVRFQVLDRPEGKPVAAKLVVRRDGEVWAVGGTGGAEDGYAEFTLPGDSAYEVEVRPRRGDAVVRPVLVDRESNEPVVVYLSEPRR